MGIVNWKKKLKDCRFQWVEEILKIWYGKEICHRGWSYKRVKFKIEIVKEMQFRAVCVLRGVEIKIIRSGGQETAWILKSPRIIRAVELEKMLVTILLMLWKSCYILIER